jgi:hypothetical protein
LEHVEDLKAKPEKLIADAAGCDLIAKPGE